MLYAMQCMLWCVTVTDLNMALKCVRYIFILTVVFRPHRSTTYVDAAYCYRPSSVVCLSQLNSTSFNRRRCVHLFVRISMTPIYNYVLIITFTDLLTVPVRLAVKLYFTSWFIQILSKHALNRLAELTSTTYHTSDPYKNGCTNRDAVWVEDSGGPKEPCIIYIHRESKKRVPPYLWL